MIRSSWSVTVTDKALEVTTFYPGTGIKNAVLIRETGIDLSAGRASSDFGREFYMTTSREEALMSAKKTVRGFSRWS